MVAGGEEVEPDLLGLCGVAHQLGGACLLAHDRVAEPGHRCSSRSSAARPRAFPAQAGVNRLFAMKRGGA